MTGERVSTAGLWSSPSVWPVLLEPILAGIPDSSDIPNSSISLSRPTYPLPMVPATKLSTSRCAR